MPVSASDCYPALLRNHAVKVIGAGSSPLVMLHGFGTDQTIWTRLVQRLGQDRKTVIYDHMGSGASNLAQYDPASYSTLQGYADDLVAILEAMALSGVTVIAHSVSGMISLLASLSTDRIDRLVMIGSSPRYLNDTDYEGGYEREDVEQLLGFMALDFQGWAKSLAPQVMDQPDQPDLTHELIFSFSRGDANVTRAFAQATFLSDHRDVLGRCKVPTLILQASADVVVPLSAARFLARGIPDARLEVLATRGHYPHVSAPDLVASAIERFLRETKG